MFVCNLLDCVSGDPDPAQEASCGREWEKLHTCVRCVWIRLLESLHPRLVCRPSTDVLSVQSVNSWVLFAKNLLGGILLVRPWTKMIYQIFLHCSAHPLPFEWICLQGKLPLNTSHVSGNSAGTVSLLRGHMMSLLLKNVSEQKKAVAKPSFRRKFQEGWDVCSTGNIFIYA